MAKISKWTTEEEFNKAKLLQRKGLSQREAASVMGKSGATLHRLYSHDTWEDFKNWKAQDYEQRKEKYPATMNRTSERLILVLSDLNDSLGKLDNTIRELLAQFNGFEQKLDDILETKQPVIGTKRPWFMGDK